MKEKTNMTTSEDILQFHFSSSTFKQSAEKVIPQSLKALLDFGIDKLQKINDSLGSNPFPTVPAVLIPQIFRKFKSSINNSIINFDRRELRTLTYSLSYSELNLQTIFSNESELKIALNAIENNWSDSLLSGLIDCLLSNWETKDQKSLEQLEQFIAKKLDNYTGNRNTLNSFKSNKRYFNTKNGDLILGDTIAKLKRPIQEATKILGVPESWFSYSYFSRVIVTYYERNKANILNEIDNLNKVLLKNNSSITSKRLVSKMIIQANQPAFAALQDRLKKIAFTQIGDPSNISNWTAFENATETEKGEIIQGRNILNEWITRQFINVFFNVCINDDRRKHFWLKYVSNITTFKVYGPSFTKSILKRDERIAEIIDARFETVFSNKDVSAFILYIGDYMIIEFSNDGYACCAYKINSSNRPALNQRLNSVDDLRNSSLPLAIQSDSNYYYTSDEGRLFHNSNWESKFNHWLKEKVLR
jgi:EH_Signature domain